MLEIREIEELVNLSDRELIGLFKQGNQNAFHQLAFRYMFVIKKRAYDLQNSTADTDDLVQEGFLGLYNAVNTYNEAGGAAFRTYASICIRNKMISAVRTASNDICAEELSEDIPVRPETEPENAFIIKEDFARLIKRIEKSLSKSEKKVLSLYLDGKSYDDIASELNKSRKFCDNAMQRVRKKLAVRN